MSLIKEYHKVVRLKIQATGGKSRMVKTVVGKQHLYDIPGKGKLPTLVILHGIGAESTSFEPIVNILQKYFKRILLPEAPAHGFSELPYNKNSINASTIYKGVINLIESEVDEKPIVFGNSMGGAIALKYAIENPEKVLAVSASSPGGANMTEEQWHKFLDRFRLKNIFDAFFFINNLMYKPSPVSLLIAPYILSTVGSPTIQTLVNNVPVEYLLTSEQLESIQVPVQFIWGKAERIMLKEHLEFFKKHLPKHAIIDEPEDFGHCPHLDRPIQLAARIIDFAEKVDKEVKSGLLKLK